MGTVQSERRKTQYATQFSIYALISHDNDYLISESRYVHILLHYPIYLDTCTASAAQHRTEDLCPGITSYGKASRGQRF